MLASAKVGQNPAAIEDRQEDQCRNYCITLDCGAKDAESQRRRMMTTAKNVPRRIEGESRDEGY